MKDDATAPLTHKQKQENRIVDRVIALIESRPSKTEGEKRGLTQRELTKFVRFMESTRLLLASASLAAMIGALYEYLTLMGIADVSPARVVLVFALFFACLFVWETVWPREWAGRAKLLSIVGGGLLCMSLGFLLDRWAIRWQRAHPPEIASLKEEVHGLGVSVQKFTEHGSSPAVEQSIIKELKPVPGFLKMQWRYLTLPLDQPNVAPQMNILYVNEGSTYTHRSTMRGALFYLDFKGTVPSPFHNEEASRSLREQVDKLAFGGYADVAPGAALYSTYTLNLITNDMYKSLEAGTARIYFAGHVEWVTNNVADHDDPCLWLQPVSWSNSSSTYDPTKEQPAWHTC